MSIPAFSEEFCVMCGESIPEGRMVCPSCEQAAADPPERNAAAMVNPAQVFGRFLQRRSGKKLPL